MGIKNLSKIINDQSPDAIQTLNINDLKGKKIAIDTSIILYQYITAIRSSGSDLKGIDNKSTSHIMGILTKTLNYLKAGIIPVHIFDGNPSELKLNIIKDRSKIKKDAIGKLLELEEQIANKEITKEKQLILEQKKITLFKQSVSINRQETNQAYEIAKLLGVPAFFAKEEADSQCAYLSRNNLVDYVATEDMDLLTFGTKNIIKNFMKSNMYVIHLDKILSDGEISMEEFIDICILLGCDYTDTINGIGYKKAWSLIKKYSTIENLISTDKNIINNKYTLPENFRYMESREYFTNPRHNEINPNDLTLNTPKLNELKQLLVNKYAFNEHNIEKMIKFLRVKYNQYDVSYKEIDPFDDIDNIISMSKTKKK
jgi:flap endonuclease-1